MRKTIKKKVSFNGLGLHSGQKSKIVLHPSDEEGINFLVNGDKIPALLEYKINSKRGTILKKNSNRVETVEHLLSALYSSGIDDCLLEFIKGNEVPIYDGSSYPFFEEIKEAGTVEKNKKRKFLKIEKNIRYNNDGVSILAEPAEGFIVDFLFDGSKFGVKNQREKCILNENNYKNIAAARTFGFWSEIEYLKKNNLAKGANLKNVLVIKNGTPYKTSYRMNKELVKHKIVDFIGEFIQLNKV